MEKHFKEMDAVHADDLQNLLLKVGLLDSLNSGKLRCKFCQNSVTEDDIYSVIKDSGQYKVVCERADCVSQLMQFLAERKGKLG